MLLIATSALLGVYLTEQQVPQKLAQAILEFTQNKYAVLAILNVFFLILGLFLHSAAAIILVVPDRHAADDPGRDRPGAVRHHRHAQPRHRPADAAGRERAHRHLRHRQGRHLEGHPRQPLVHRRAACRADLVHLRAGRVADARSFVLPVLADAGWGRAALRSVDRRSGPARRRGGLVRQGVQARRLRPLDNLTIALCISIGQAVAWLIALYTERGVHLLFWNVLFATVGAALCALAIAWIVPTLGLLGLVTAGPICAVLMVVGGHALRIAAGNAIRRAL